jgi:hypothetical protein
MFFLLRVAFWLSIVLVLLPSGGAERNMPEIGASEAVSAAFAAVSDMSGFCERQPDACDVGGKAAVAFGHRAQAGAKFLFDYLTDKMSPAETGSISAPRTIPASQDTLSAQDLKPVWRGPQTQSAEGGRPEPRAPLPPKDPRRPA